MVISMASAQEAVIWQIGQFDNDYKEFAIAGNYGAFSQAFPNDVTFTVGKDDPAKAWPFVQPGPGDAWAGSKAHPFTIIFDLPGQPVGTYTLTIDMVNTHYSGPPTYEISVNGKSGRFNLPNGGGDESLTDPSKGKEHVISLPLPASLFKQGENRIILTSIDGSWLVYDALKLTNSPQATTPQAGVNRLILTPTIFCVKQDSGLKQVLRLTAEVVPGSGSAMATIRVGEKSQEVTIEPDLMGSATAEVLIDEVSAPAKAEVTLQDKTASCDLIPQKHWKIYLQPSAHVDIGYTDHQDRCAQRHNDNMATALDLCEKYPDFKWNTEVAWVEDNFLTMEPGRRADFAKFAKEGRIGCQAIYGNMLTGICSHESFIRDLYYSHSAARQYGIPWDIAMSSDVPTQVGTLPTILAGAGIKYFSAGLNLTRGDSFNKLFNKPFYWQGPDGGKVLTWLSPGYAYAAHLGLNANISQAESKIEGFLNGFNRDDYAYDAVLAFGGFSDNQPLDANLAQVVDEWNKEYAYPQVILCRGPEFFEYVEANFKDKIPTIAGDGGVYWEDGAGSSAMETALVRQAKEDLVAAEKLFALIGAEPPRADLKQAWKNAILYDEHTWGAHCSISQPESEQTVSQWKVKAQFAYDAADQSANVLQRGLNTLAASVSPSIAVFNPLSWPVSGPVSAKTADGKSIEFWAENVPPVGYKTFPISHKPSAISHSSGGGLENAYYRITFDPATGAVKSIYDKELNRELVDQSARYGVNQYIYMQGQKDAKDITRDANTPKPTMTLETRPHGQAMVIQNAGAMALEFTTEVILYDKIKRIDFVNKLFKDDTLEKEAGYFAFPFALNKPEFYVELPDGVVKPKSQMLPGACMQWYCLQDFVAAADDKAAVVWTAIESPLFTIGDINRETFKSPLPIENGHLYAYIFNNYWFTNYKASQDSDMIFRFSLTSMPKYDPVAASRFGQSVRNPLMAVVGQAAQSKMPKEASFCLVKPSNVVVQAVKDAEYGDGIIIRLRELAGKKTKATVALPKDFTRAWACNLVEDPQSELKVDGGKVTVTLPAYGLATIQVK